MAPAAAAKEKLTLATLPTLRSPLDADHKLFAPPRASTTTGTVYSAREPQATQAGKPRAAPTTKKPTAVAKKPATTKRTTTRKATTTRR
jgi:hypothetical protein